MAVIEGVNSAQLMGVGAEAFIGAHVAKGHIALGAGGAFRVGAVSGTMAAALAANAEIFQFRYVTAASRIALINRVTISAGANVAATAAALLSMRMTVARAWTVAGSGGSRIVLTGDNANLRTSLATSEVNDAGISTTAGLTAGTKTLDTTDIGNVSYGIGTGAITTSLPLTILPLTELFNANQEGGYPLVLANQEGFVIRSGIIGPATMTWAFSVNVSWLEVPAF
jgi:hypothetical protein